MIRLDYEIIADIIEPGARVLDLGCGDGELLSLLKQKKSCRGTGIEIDQEQVVRCMERGVSVSQGSLDSDMDVYEDKRFDCVILNPNFCHIRARFQLFFMGQVPVTKSLPYKWYNTPNLRFLSLKDFRDFCKEKNIRIERARYLCQGNEVLLMTNMLADSGIFVLTRG